MVKWTCLQGLIFNNIKWKSQESGWRWKICIKSGFLHLSVQCVSPGDLNKRGTFSAEIVILGVLIVCATFSLSASPACLYLFIYFIVYTEGILQTFIYLWLSQHLRLSYCGGGDPNDAPNGRAQSLLNGSSVALRYTGEGGLLSMVLQSLSLETSFRSFSLSALLTYWQMCSAPGYISCGVPHLSHL